MKCPYCRAQNGINVLYCGNCGRFIADPSSRKAVEGESSPSRSLAPGSRLQGSRYIIKAVLGQGGMGAALLAIDNRLDGKPVVIKELLSESADPTRFQEDVRNFKREVAILAHIDHPLIPNVTDHFQEGARYFMVQEYVEGENLENRLARTKQPMQERDALICAAEVLDVLDYLSVQTPPVVHRDIKPANIIIGVKDKRAHLVDFGIARAEVLRNAQRKQTSALGTPGYAPPEQYQGNADPRSDLYALGATLHHVLTMRDPCDYPPFTYPPVRSLNAQLSPDIERVLTRALNNDIELRYQRADKMKQDVEEILRQRFGVVGSINSYSLGDSGTMRKISSPDLTSMPAMTSQSGQSGQSTSSSASLHLPLPSSAPFHLATPVPVGQMTPVTPPLPSSVTPPYLPPSFVPPPPRRRISGWQYIMSSLSTSLQNTAGQILSFIKHEARKKSLPFFAIARVELENDDRASVGKTYMIEAGIAQNQPARFTGAPFTLPNQNRIDPIWFDLVLHSSDNIDLGEKWHQRLHYDPRNIDPQLVAFSFHFTRAGRGTLVINFYHELRWLKTIRFEVETIEQLIPGVAATTE